jgi:sortase A
MPGEVGNTVIAGHRDTHFQFLKDIQTGELLQLESSEGQKHTYKVVAVDIVDSRRGSLLLDTDDALMSLVTCYPFDAREAGSLLRYVVTARMLY